MTAHAAYQCTFWPYDSSSSCRSPLRPPQPPPPPTLVTLSARGGGTHVFSLPLGGQHGAPIGSLLHLHLDPVRHEVFPGPPLPSTAERAVQGDQVQGHRPSGGD